MKFRLLIAAHVPDEPAEATLVLAAVAAFAGLTVTGEVMPGACPAAVSARALADELGVHVGVVRRGLAHLVDRGVIDDDGGVAPGALLARWGCRSCVIRLPDGLRDLRDDRGSASRTVRAEVMLVAGLVAGQLDKRGRLVMGLERMAAVTGIARRCLQRALTTAEAVGALHRWLVPGRWLTCLAPGPRREPARGKRREPAQENEVSGDDRREPARPPVSNRRGPRREPARSSSQTGARLIGSPSESDRKQPSEAERPEAIGGRAGAGQGQRAAVDEGEPPSDLVSAILRTGLRSRLEPLAQLQFAVQLARPLHAAGMTTSDCLLLWARACRRATSGDPAGLFRTMLAGPWRREVDEELERQQHAAAVARGRVQEPSTPTHAGELVTDLLDRMRQA